MEENFENSMTFIFKWEGGYCNDSNDPGGETKFGISKKAYPSLTIKNLTRDDAKQIYHHDYWLKCLCNKLPKNIDLVVFDFAVNGGTTRSIKTLQQAITKCGFEIEIDGIIGNETLMTIDKINVDKLLRECITQRENYYDSLVLKSPKLQKFRKGWQNRVDDLKKAVEV